ncbi:MAG: MFS transporter [Polaromonas sp.]|nr:MFS transporter [Polaromonas sp.]
MTQGFATVSPALRRSILLLSFATFASMAAQRICDAMLPELSRAFSVSLAEAARVVSVFAVAYALSQIVWGPLGDRLGKFGVVTFGTLACAGGCVLAAFAASLDMLLLARILTALGAATIIPLSMAWIGDEVAYEMRQETLARVGLGTTLGIVGGQLFGGLLSDTLGWRWAFGFLALLFGVVGALLATDWRRHPAAARSAEGASGERPGFVAQALQIVTGPWSRVVLAVALVEGAAGFGVLALWAAHLNSTLALSLTASGAIVALFGPGGMLYMAVARQLIRRWGERGLVQWGGGLFAVSTAVVGLTPAWGPAVPASLLAGFGFFMFHNTMQAHVTQMAPDARGTGVSLFASALFLGQSVGVVLAAESINRIGSSAVIVLAAALFFGLALFFAGALGRRQRDKTEVAG